MISEEAAETKENETNEPESSEDGPPPSDSRVCSRQVSAGLAAGEGLKTEMQPVHV